MKAVQAMAVIAVCAFLSACSTMQGIGAAVGALGSDAPSLDATAQVGKENTKEGDAVVDNRRVTSSQTDTSLDSGIDTSSNSGVSSVVSKNDSSSQVETAGSNAVTSKDWTADTIEVQQIPTGFLVLFALGWILPSASKTFKGIGKGLLFIKNKVFGEGG